MVDIFKEKSTYSKEIFGKPAQGNGIELITQMMSELKL